MWRMSKEVCINVVLGAIETTGISVVVYGLRRVQRACGFTTVTNRRVYCPAVGMAIGGDADGVCEWREVQCVRLEIVQQNDCAAGSIGFRLLCSKTVPALAETRRDKSAGGVRKCTMTLSLLLPLWTSATHATSFS